MPERTTRPKQKTMQERIDELRTRRDEVIAGGGEKRHAKQHEAGKLTARERIAELVDPLSFEESGMLAQHRPVSEIGLIGVIGNGVGLVVPLLAGRLSDRVGRRALTIFVYTLCIPSFIAQYRQRDRFDRL